ncbi:MAG TPA: bifunctional riboflavin kinase/FAD synthetase [Gemmatimonadaceae bacterium]|nr:bifunctional riboflavin kinase/FAD synthetase [Gemmatimonadaceae bacterium]
MMMSEWRADGVSGLPPTVEATVVTVGTFDGVHRGHQAVLRRLAERSRETGWKAVLVTFEPHPLEVVNPAAARPLLTVGAERQEVLAESGIDYCAVLPFSPTLSHYTAEQFVGVLLERFHMRELLSGYDNGFGRGREGDVETLRAIGMRRGFRVEVVPPMSGDDGRPISSTSIRRAVAGGDLRSAAAGLGRPYSVSGIVSRGHQRGRTIGFPTINLPLPSPRKLLPPEGVYAVRVQTPAGPYGGMMNLGARPTFGETDVTLEAHLFDADGDWYGAHVRIEFVSRLRDTQKFDGIDALKSQLARDEQNARHALMLQR